AVSSGKYPGLRWTDPARRIFRIPWKHNARKDVTSSDLEIFKAWAKASGRYEGCPEDPAKWKTNFRCALRSTRMFVLQEDHSKSGDDPHKVFAIAPGEPRDLWGVAVDQAILGHLAHAALLPVTRWHSEEGDFSSPDPVVNQQPLHQQLQVRGWAPMLRHCNLGPLPTGDFSAGDVPHQDTLLQPHPDSSQNNCLPPLSFQQWVPMAEQPPLGTNSPLNPMLLQEHGGCCGAGFSPGHGNAIMAWDEAGLLPYGIIPILDVSIYYRGKLFHQEEVRDSRCLLAYQTSDPALALRPGHLVRFPSPAELADGKQRHFTENLLSIAGLQLEQHSQKLFATRLKKCKVFWALSQQLEGVGDPPPNLLYRDQETPIFDFNEFCSELRDFRNRQRQQSPDFTIYLCFGQCFSKAKPKESKLILVKLVPKFCEYCYEQVLREGASSLDSGTVSLQLSDSFSLFELIEQCSMQMD
ncbi:IRF3 factor, partial [Hemiprocne comata]|nr:IRF3 factor [Hemiprocne comata]